MPYTKPEVTVLGDATCLIRGLKSCPPYDPVVLQPRVWADAELDE